MEDPWIMFDHVKRVKGWTTMACYVYDSAYCRVMTIVVCDMQSEDVVAQSILWHGLNKVMERHGVRNVNFKGFMDDSAQANWNAVRVIYGNGDPMSRWNAVRRLVSCTGWCLWNAIPPLASRLSSNSNTSCSASNTRTPSPLNSPSPDISQSELGGYP